MSAKELNIGDYVRTKGGEITRITKVCIEGYVNEVYVEDDVYTEYWGRKTDCLHIGTDWKSSPNIIDLIEVGDYVNGMDLLGVFDKYIEAEEMINDLKKYKIHFGTEEEYIIYNFNVNENMNKYIDYEDLKKLEVIRIEGVN